MFLLLRLNFIILCGRSASLFAISCNSRAPAAASKTNNMPVCVDAAVFADSALVLLLESICTASIRRSGIGIDRFQRVDGCLHLCGQLIDLSLRDLFIIHRLCQLAHHPIHRHDAV